METSLKTGFAQIFSHCPKNLSCPKFGGSAAPLAPPARTPMLLNDLTLSCGYMAGNRLRGPFLESPGNFTGPKSNIQIEI